MKAKEMIAIAREAYSRAVEVKDMKIMDEAVVKICNILFTDTKALHMARGAKSDAALMAVLLEMDIKYQALVRALPGVFKADGYRALFKDVIDEGRKAGIWKGE